jgi:hypothetical protein
MKAGHPVKVALIALAVHMKVGRLVKAVLIVLAGHMKAGRPVKVVPIVLHVLMKVDHPAKAVVSGLNARLKIAPPVRVVLPVPMGTGRHVLMVSAGPSAKGAKAARLVHALPMVSVGLTANAAKVVRAERVPPMVSVVPTAKNGKVVKVSDPLVSADIMETVGRAIVPLERAGPPVPLATAHPTVPGKAEQALDASGPIVPHVRVAK